MTVINISSIGIMSLHSFEEHFVICCCNGHWARLNSSQLSCWAEHRECSDIQKVWGFGAVSLCVQTKNQSQDSDRDPNYQGKKKLKNQISSCQVADNAVICLHLLCFRGWGFCVCKAILLGTATCHSDSKQLLQNKTDICHVK